MVSVTVGEQLASSAICIAVGPATGTVGKLACCMLAKLGLTLTDSVVRVDKLPHDRDMVFTDSIVFGFLRFGFFGLFYFISVYVCRKKEEETRRRLLENPIKMKQLKKTVSTLCLLICLD